MSDQIHPIRRNGSQQPPAEKTATALTPDQQEFAYWLSLPMALRKPQLQKDWARAKGISREATLSEWKQLPALRDLLREYRREFADELAGEALWAWRRAIRRGNWDAVRAALEHGGILAPERPGQLASVNVGIVMDPHRAARLAELADKLEEQGE